MAYRSRSTARKTTRRAPARAGRTTRYAGSRKAAPKRATARPRSGNGQTIRIVIEQPSATPAVRPMVAASEVERPKTAKF